MNIPVQVVQSSELGLPNRPNVPKDDKHIPYLRSTSINPIKIEGEFTAQEGKHSPQPAEQLPMQPGVKVVIQENLTAGVEEKNNNNVSKESPVREGANSLWESLKQLLIEQLNKRYDDKALEKLLETLPVENRPDGLCFVCSNKAEHSLLLEKMPVLQELLNQLAPEAGIKLSATVKEVPAALTKPKPAKPTEICEAMTEKNPALLKFIEQLKLKLD